MIKRYRASLILLLFFCMAIAGLQVTQRQTPSAGILVERNERAAQSRLSIDTSPNEAHKLPSVAGEQDTNASNLAFKAQKSTKIVLDKTASSVTSTSSSFGYKPTSSRTGLTTNRTADSFRKSSTPSSKASEKTQSTANSNPDETQPNADPSAATPTTADSSPANQTPASTNQPSTPTTQPPTTTSTPSTTQSSPATTTTTPTPSCGAHWGAYVNPFQRTGGYDAGDRLQAIQYVENQMGRKFAIDHQFYRWDDFVSTYNIDNYIKPSIAQGRKPFLSWKPVYKNNTNIAWSSIADGDHDTLIRQKAQQVKSIGAPIILVFGHEADSRVGTFQPGQTESGHVKTDAGSAADFVAAYRHVHNVFAQEGVTNVDWAWIMTRAPFEPNAGARSANLLYPGNSYVDIVGLDPYNFFHGGNWREMQTLMGGFTSWVSTNNITKPWMIAEWGSVEDPNQAGRKAQWLHNAADYFESEPRLKYIIHFDSFPIYNWRFDSSPSSAAAWKEISNRSHFTCP